MVNYSAALDNTFVALSSPVRRTMLARLAHGWVTVGELAEPFGITSPAITKHLRILERAGLIRREKRGRQHYLHLVPAPIAEATDWMRFHEQFWTSQFESLNEFLASSEDLDHEHP